MRRTALVTAAVVALLALPALAAGPAGVDVTRYPAPPRRPASAGDLIIGVSMFDGTSWRVIDGLVLQPDRPEPLACEAPRGPTRPQG